MKKQTALFFTKIVAFAFVVGLLSGCKGGSNQTVSTVSAELSTLISLNDLDRPSVLEQTEFYKILKGQNDVYYYYIYYVNGKVAEEGGTTSKPVISLYEGKYVRRSKSVGINILTQKTRYFDVSQAVASQEFEGVFNEWQDLVVYADQKKVIVQNIFDKKKYYREFSKFKNQLSDTVTPFVDIEFVNSGKQIRVTYVTGVSNTLPSEVFDLQ